MGRSKSKLEGKDIATEEKKDCQDWKIPLVFALPFIHSCLKQKNFRFGTGKGKGWIISL
jgi:hypothetical protein